MFPALFCFCAAWAQQPVVSKPVAFALSAPVRDFGMARPEAGKTTSRRFVVENEVINKSNEKRIKEIIPGLGGKTGDQIQSTVTVNNLTDLVTGPITSFDGNSSADNFAAYGGRVSPPDVNGDVGPNHYVQTTNLLVGIFDKTTGALVVPKFKMSTLFASLGPPFSTLDSGDPIALYDQLSDRWLLSQFLFTTSTSGVYYQVIAISQTGDPTGAYYVYAFLMPNNKLNDYPHFGVWPDGYYMADNQFTNGGPFSGAGAFAFDRAKMLVGDPTASYIYFDQAVSCPSCGGQLPTDLDGFATPPVGTPNLFMEFRADEFGDPADGLRIFAFHADFATPANSTFTQVGGTDLPLAAFDARSPAGRADIEQPAPSTAVTGLDGISDRLMYRLAYRVLPGGEQSYVGNFTVNVSGVTPTTVAGYQAGIKWFELRRSAAGVMSVKDEGIFAPGAGNGAAGRNIWMASIAQDGEGNLGLGYSASSTSLFPSILYTGRLTSDPAGTMGQGENTLVAGSGVQLATGNRWGDYSSMSVDPVDECTFWYTQEYYTAASQATSNVGWLTRIGSFKVNPGCVVSNRGTITGTVTNCATGAPIANAIVTTPDGFFAKTNAAGQYSILAASGSYTVVITMSGGYSTCSTNNVIVTNGGNTVVNCCIAPSAIMVAAGAVLTAESCSPPNTAIDPNETVTVDLSLSNIGGLNTTNLVATLQATGGVTAPGGPQNYGVVVGGGGPVSRPFTFTTANVSCSDLITATLQLQDGATDLGTVTYTFITGAASTAVATFSYTGPAVAIPDNIPAGVNIPVTVSGAGVKVTDLNFRFDALAGCNTTTGNTNSAVDHTYISDLIFKLTSPGGTTVTFVQSRGSGGKNICNLFLDDDGAFPPVSTISTGGAVSGNYAPENPFSAFDGQTANGNWILNVSDNAAVDIGSVRGFSIILTTSTPECCITISCTPAVISCPGNITVDNSPGQCGANVDYPAATATGTSPTITYSRASGSFFPVGTTTVTATATNDCGTSSCTFTITVNDNEAPAISCPAAIVVNNTTGQCGAKVCYPMPSVSDNCPPLTPAGYTPIATYGNSHYYISTVMSNYATAEANALAAGGHLVVITSAAENNAIAASGAGFSWMGGNDLSSEGVFQWANCEPYSYSNFCAGEPNGGTFENHLEFETGGCWNDLSAGTLRYSILEIESAKLVQTAGLPPNSFFPVGITTNTFVVTDAAGNTATCSFTVTVVDNQAPTITCPGNQVFSSEPNVCGAQVGYIITTSDNCPGQILTQTAGLPSFSTFPVGTTLNTFKVTDASGNSSTCSFTITVNDVQAPTLTCPGPITVCAGSIPPQNIASVTNVTDNCPGTVVTWRGDVNNCPGCVNVPYTITRTYRATDAAGNYAECTQIITVNPVNYFACPGNMTEYINDVTCVKKVNTENPVFCGTLTKLTWKLTGATILSSPTSGINYLGPRNMNVGTTTVTYTATFTGGVVKTCSFTVLVIETKPPEIRCPLDKTINADPGKCYKTGPVSLGTPTTSDNCGVASVTNNAPAVYVKGQNFVTWTVTDKSGNTATCVQIVTVVDAEKPILTCPGNVVVNAGPGPNCRATQVSIAPPVFSDNCAVVKLTWVMTGVTWGGSPNTGINYVPAMDFAVGVSTITYTAYDAAGNGKTCSFTVTVNDVTPPTLVCPPAQTLCKVPNNNYNIPQMIQSDNCAIVSTKYAITGATSRTGSGTNASGLFNLGVSTIKWTVTDSHGKISTCTTIVTVVATTNPLCVPTAPAAPFVKYTEAEVPGLSITAWPNPSVNYFNLKVNSPSREKLAIRMYDMAGKPVQSKSGVPGETFSLGEGLLPGMYIVEVRQAGNTVRTKLTKQ